MKLLLLEKNPTDLAKASTHLEPFVLEARTLHMVRALIDALAIKAVLLEAQGEGDSATSVLAESLQLALPGGIVRTFIDLGQPMAQLLSRVRAEDEVLRFIGKILAAFRDSAEQLESTGPLAGPSVQQSSLDPLSKRERKELLLVGGLRLFDSPF